MRSSKEVRKESVAQDPSDDKPLGNSPNDASCVEIFQSRIPFFRTIIKVLSGSASQPAVSEKLQSVISRPPPPSILFLEVSDGSCAASLQVVLNPH